MRRKGILSAVFKCHNRNHNNNNLHGNIQYLFFPSSKRLKRCSLSHNVPENGAHNVCRNDNGGCFSQGEFLCFFLFFYRLFPILLFSLLRFTLFLPFFCFLFLILRLQFLFLVFFSLRLPRWFLPFYLCSGIHYSAPLVTMATVKMFLYFLPSLTHLLSFHFRLRVLVPFDFFYLCVRH